MSSYCESILTNSHLISFKYKNKNFINMNRWHGFPHQLCSSVSLRDLSPEWKNWLRILFNEVGSFNRLVHIEIKTTLQCHRKGAFFSDELLPQSPVPSQVDHIFMTATWGPTLVSPVFLFSWKCGIGEWLVLLFVFSPLFNRLHFCHPAHSAFHTKRNSHSLSPPALSVSGTSVF